MTIKRIKFMQELLAFMGLEGRLHLAWISSAEAQKFVEVVSDFTEKIREKGPTPLGGNDRVLFGNVGATPAAEPGTVRGGCHAGEG